jgi:hypothetical protein
MNECKDNGSFGETHKRDSDFRISLTILKFSKSSLKSSSNSFDFKYCKKKVLCAKH